MRLRSDRRFLIDAPIERVWAAIARPDRYMSWWPWLRFDARELLAGERWKCTVRSPLGHQLRFDVTLCHVVPPTHDPPHDRGSVRGVVSGDITGTATLTVDRQASDAGSGAERSVVRLVSDLESTGRALQLVSRASPPLARWCHDRVLDRGIEQFGRVVRTASATRPA